MDILETVKVINLADLNVADYIIIGFVLWGAVKGYRRGLMRGFVVLFCWAAALVAAYFLSPWGVALLDENMGLITALTEIIKDKLPVEVLAGNSILQDLSLSGFDLSALDNYAGELLLGSPGGVEGVIEVLSRQAGTLLAYGLVFVLFVVAGYLALRLVIVVFSRRFGSSVLGFFNRMTGMLFGAGINIVVAGLAVGLLTPWLVLGSWEQGGFLFNMGQYLTESTIAPYFSYLFIWVSAALSGMPL